MLSITVPALELWDEEKNEFNSEPSFQLQFEHSLASLSKWESKYQRPFLVDDQKTSDEMLWYIYFMLIPPGVSFEELSRLSVENIQEINSYIDSKQTATTFRESMVKKGRAEKITAELIYYWMYSFGIPTEWENRHLNRLFALIRIFSAKQGKGGGKQSKQSRAEAAEWQRSENARRRAELGTRG